MQSKIIAAARVRLEIEVEVGSKWGGECALSQVHKQAAEEATNFIENMLITVSKESGRAIRLVRTPPIVETIVIKS